MRNLPVKDDAQAEMGFFDHLEELRKHIIRAIIAVVVSMLVIFLLKNYIFDYLIFGPRNEEFPSYVIFCKISHWIGMGERMCLKPPQFELINYEMSGQFLTHIKVSLILGFILSFPYISWEIWRFIRPALFEKEKKYTRGIVFTTSMLFFMGVAFGYFILSPFSINFFVNYSVSGQVDNMIALVSYISIISMVVLATGVMFELPMVVYILSKLGLLTPSDMRKYRRHAAVGILFIAAMITPADIWTQVLVALPVFILYEISILISWYVNKKSDPA